MVGGGGIEAPGGGIGTTDVSMDIVTGGGGVSPELDHGRSLGSPDGGGGGGIEPAEPHESHDIGAVGGGGGIDPSEGGGGGGGGGGGVPGGPSGGGNGESVMASQLHVQGQPAGAGWPSHG